MIQVLLNKCVGKGECMRVVVISDKVVHGITMETSLGNKKKKKERETTKGADRPGGKNGVFQSLKISVRLKIV